MTVTTVSGLADLIERGGPVEFLFSMVTGRSPTAVPGAGA
jgi:hypothetical protein